MASIDERLKNFIESEVATIVATRDEELQPEATFGWAPRVLGPREVELFIDKSRSEQTLRNLRSNRLIAVTLSSPITHYSTQLKGFCLDISEPQPADRERIEKHREMLVEALRARGIPAHVSRGYWTRETLRVRFEVEELFDQTPGPGAGYSL